MYTDNCVGFLLLNCTFWSLVKTSWGLGNKSANYDILVAIWWLRYSSFVVLWLNKSLSKENIKFSSEGSDRNEIIDCQVILDTILIERKMAVAICCRQWYGPSSGFRPTVCRAILVFPCQLKPSGRPTLCRTVWESCYYDTIGHLWYVAS
jgi:hypothetical protein